MVVSLQQHIEALPVKACFFIGRSYGLERRRKMTRWTKLKDLLDCMVEPKGWCFSALKWMSLPAFIELLE